MSNKDPIGALIDYVNHMKPYHSKIAEVLIEYIYADVAKVSTSEDLYWEIDLIYETDALDCEEGFGSLPYGNLAAPGSRKLNPFKDENSLYYRDDLDVTTPNYDTDWALSSPAPTNRELIVSLHEYPVDSALLLLNPFYDPSDPEYDDRIDASSANYDPAAFEETLDYFTIAVSLQYPYPSATSEGTVDTIVNPFRDGGSVNYVPALDSSNVAYDENEDPANYTLEQQAASLFFLEVNGSPLNPFYDAASPNHIDSIDRYSLTYNSSDDFALYTLDEQAASLVYLPYVESSIVSNWENGACPEPDPSLASGVTQDNLDETDLLERTGNFANDFNLLFDRFNLFQYNTTNDTITQNVDSGSPSIVALAKANFTIPEDGNVYYWEYELVLLTAETVEFGIFPFDVETIRMPYEMGEADGTKHLSEFETSVVYDSAGNVFVNGVLTSTATALATGNILGIRMDTSTNDVSFYVNGALTISVNIGTISHLTSGLSVEANANGSTITLISDQNDLTFPSVGDMAIPINT